MFFLPQCPDAICPSGELWCQMPDIFSLSFHLSFYALTSMLDFFPIIINGCLGAQPDLLYNYGHFCRPKKSYYFNNSDLRDNRIIYNKSISTIRGLKCEDLFNYQVIIFFKIVFMNSKRTVLTLPLPFQRQELHTIKSSITNLSKMRSGMKHFIERFFFSLQ